MPLNQLSPDGSLREPALAELLEDPIMQLLWRRDGLRMEDVAEQLDAARQRFRQSRLTAISPISTAA
jgi:hypothetical protein